METYDHVQSFEEYVANYEKKIAEKTKRAKRQPKWERGYDPR